MVTYEITDDNGYTTTRAFRFNSYDNDGPTSYTIEHTNDLSGGFWDDVAPQDPCYTVAELADLAKHWATMATDDAEKAALVELAELDPSDFV